jgi:AAA ATPase domain
MDASTDPYEPGAGTSPPVLAGRDGEQAVFDARRARLQAGRRAQGLALRGLRGVGKTVLLRDFKRRAEEDNWLTGIHELGVGEPLRPVIAQTAIDAIETLHGPRRLRGAAHHALRVLHSFTVTAMPHGVSFSLAVQPERGRADSGQLQQDTHDVLAELGAVARQAGSGVTLLFDELQLADPRELGALLRAVQQLEDRELPILVVGAGLPDLPVRLVEASSYAERMFTYHQIGELDAGAARDALSLPAEHAGVAGMPPEPWTLDRLGLSGPAGRMWCPCPRRARRIPRSSAANPRALPPTLSPAGATVFRPDPVLPLSLSTQSVSTERGAVHAYTPDALDYIISRAGGFPFFLQTYGSHAWQSARASPIDLAAAQRAEVSARRALDNGFSPYPLGAGHPRRASLPTSPRRARRRTPANRPGQQTAAQSGRADNHGPRPPDQHTRPHPQPRTRPHPVQRTPVRRLRPNPPKRCQQPHARDPHHPSRTPQATPHPIDQLLDR